MSQNFQTPSYGSNLAANQFFNTFSSFSIFSDFATTPVTTLSALAKFDFLIADGDGVRALSWSRFSNSSL